MTKRNGLFTLAFLLLVHLSHAQVTQLELASGFNKTDFTTFSVVPLHAKEKISLATLAFFQKFHASEDLIYDELGVQATLYWNINKSVSIGSGLYYNSVAGFSERISLRYTLRSKHLVLTIIPTLAHAEATGFMNGEMVMQIQLTESLNQDLSLLLHAQILSNWDKFSIHTRSFQQIRAGVEYKTHQFGVAVDFDQYGESPVTRTSIGLFARKTFLNN